MKLEMLQMELNNQISKYKMLEDKLNQVEAQHKNQITNFEQ